MQEGRGSRIIQQSAKKMLISTWQQVDVRFHDTNRLISVTFFHVHVVTSFRIDEGDIFVSQHEGVDTL